MSIFRVAFPRSARGKEKLVAELINGKYDFMNSTVKQHEKIQINVAFHLII